jgi:hypothetical protein
LRQGLLFEPGFKVAILSPPPPNKCWDYRHAPPYLATHPPIVEKKYWVHFFLFLVKVKAYDLLLNVTMMPVHIRELGKDGGRVSCSFHLIWQIFPK